jgi:hypothetical protein
MAELSAAETTADRCCAPERQASCCEPSAKADCCGHEDGCGCAARGERETERARSRGGVNTERSS